MVAAADDAPRRMEWVSTDGAQQRLLAGAIALGSACSRLARTFGDDAVAALDEVGAELDGGLAELRDIARAAAVTAGRGLVGLADRIEPWAGRSPSSALVARDVRYCDVPAGGA